MFLRNEKSSTIFGKDEQRHFTEVVVIEFHELEAIWAEMGQVIDPKGSTAKLRHCGSPAGVV